MQGFLTASCQYPQKFQPQDFLALAGSGDRVLASQLFFFSPPLEMNQESKEKQKRKNE